MDYHHVLRQTYRSEEFAGRRWLFERIEAAFKDRDRGFIVVAAGPGFGKTAFALQLIERWRDAGVGDVALGAWHVLRKTESTWWPAVQLVGQLEWRLRNRLACPLAGDADKLDEKNAAPVLKQALIDAAAQAKKAHQRLLLVVDGLDEAFGANAPASAAEQALLLREIFPGPQALPEGVFVLFTSRPGGHLSAWLNQDALLIDVDRDDAAKRDNEADLVGYLQARLTAVDDRSSYDPQRTSELAKRMAQACEGAFFAAEWFARKAGEDAAQFERWLAGEKLPRGIDGVLREDWKHKLGSLKHDVQRRLLPVLAAAIAIWHEAGTRVTAEIIEDLFTKARTSDLDVGDMQADEIRGPAVRGVLAKLGDWFDAGAGQSNPVYTYRHSRIPELILELEGKPHEMLVDARTQREVHRLLAWTSSRWGKLHSASRKAALAYAPWHFAQAEILGSVLEVDPMEGGAMRLLAHWLGPNPYLAAVYAELDDAVSILSRNYAAAITLAAQEAQPSARDSSEKPDPLQDRLLHLRDVWRVLSEHGELLREPCCPLAPALYNHLAAAWDVQSQAHRDLVQAAEAYAGTWLQRMNPESPDRRLIAVLRGHTRRVTCLALSPDGTRIASGSEDETIRLWDGRTGAVFGEPLTLQTWIDSIAWSPNGAQLASGTIDGSVRLWDSGTGAPTGGPLTAHTGSVGCVAWSPDGTQLASADRHVIRLWDALTWAPLGAPSSEVTGDITCIAWSPDGARLAWVTSEDPNLRLWNLQTDLAESEALAGHSDEIIAIAWSPDGTKLASGSRDETVRLWDRRTSSQLREPLTGHRGTIRCLAWSDDGTRLASGSHDRTVRIWDANTGAPVGDPLGGHTSWVTCLVWAPDSTRLASGSDDSVRLWATRTGTPLGNPLIGHSGDIKSIAWSGDGTRLASYAESDPTVRLWDTSSDTLGGGGPLPTQSQQIEVIALSPNGNRLASNSVDHAVRLWDARTGEPVSAPLTGHSSTVTCFAWSPDSTQLASGSLDHTVRLWDANTGASAGGPLIGNSPWFERLAWSPDGTRLADVTREHTVRLWDVCSAAVLSGRMIGCTEEEIHCLAWSPDGALLATASKGGTLHLWDGRTGMPVGDPLIGHTRDILCLAWTPDGTRLASGSYDETIRLWDVRTRAPLGSPLSGHSHWVNCLAWSPDGCHIAAGLTDGALYLWDMRSGEGVSKSLLGHRGAIANLAWLSGKRCIVSVSTQGELRLWDAIEGSCLACAINSGKGDEFVTSGDDCLMAGVRAGIMLSSHYRFHYGFRAP